MRASVKSSRPANLLSASGPSPRPDRTAYGEDAMGEASTRVFSGGCHCGAVRFEAELADGLDKVVRCTCSYCRMKGSVMAFAPLAQLRFTAGEDDLSVYQFNTQAARHYF